MKLPYFFLITFLITPVVVRAAEDPYAAQLFKQNCASCHETAAAAPGARSPRFPCSKR
jgi:mono/diheme cytochrome c family protein